MLLWRSWLSDPSMIRLLEDRAKAGVQIKIIGRLTRRSTQLEARKLPAEMRLHARTMIRDSHLAFIGSQSLRKVELDSRREVGIIFGHPGCVSRLVKIFSEDWASTEMKQQSEDQGVASVVKAAKKVAKAIARDLPPVAPALEQAEVVGDGAKVELNSKEIEETVKDALKDAIQEVVKDAVDDAMEDDQVLKPT